MIGKICGYTRSHKEGFTLIELMVSVTIIAVIAATAIPAFVSYRYKARAQEAIEFLGVIKLRQESYRAEFGVYCDVDTPHPSSGSGPSGAPKNEDLLWNPSPVNWQQLAAAPGNSRVEFQFNVIAGTPDALPSPNSWNFPGTDFWYVATAVSDLDADGTQVTFDAIPGRKGVWCNLAKGWE